MRKAGVCRRMGEGLGAGGTPHGTSPFNAGWPDGFLSNGIEAPRPRAAVLHCHHFGRSPFRVRGHPGKGKGAQSWLWPRSAPPFALWPIHGHPKNSPSRSPTVALALQDARPRGEGSLFCRTGRDASSNGTSAARPNNAASADACGRATDDIRQHRFYPATTTPRGPDAPVEFRLRRTPSRLLKIYPK
jgi:hypothetical protein